MRPQFYITYEIVTPESAEHGDSAEQWAILESGPDAESYWDVWTEVCDSCVVTDDKQNVKYTIYQDGDCWLVPIGMEWNDELGGFAQPEEETDDE